MVANSKQGEQLWWSLCGHPSQPMCWPSSGDPHGSTGQHVEVVRGPELLRTLTPAPTKRAGMVCTPPDLLGISTPLACVPPTLLHQARWEPQEGLPEPFRLNLTDS